MNKFIKTLTNSDVLNIIKGGGDFNPQEGINYHISTDIKLTFELIEIDMNKIQTYINRNYEIKRIYKIFNSIAEKLSLLKDTFTEFNESIIKNETKKYTIENFESRMDDFRNRTISLIEQQRSNNGIVNGIISYRTSIYEVVNDKIIPVYYEILELYDEINNQ